MSVAPPAELAAAREQFLAVVDALRPDLHRYATRLVGSAIDGEDVVQDTLAKAFYALSLASEVPPLRPWLFRICRNTAIDMLRRYERKNVQALPDEDSTIDPSQERDPEVLRAALSAFLALPVAQRSAVILKDVLGESLEDIAAHLDTTVAAVKSLLVRGRAALRAEATRDSPGRREGPTPAERALLHRYVDLFNQRDWPAVQALLVEEVRLDLVSKSQRQGKAVGMYFGRYEKETGLVFKAGSVEGRSAVGAFRDGALAYVILLESVDGRVSSIRDFRYVPYLASELVFVPD
jgi:RNA polymerase sigma-70 factor, ECF subfamily